MDLPVAVLMESWSLAGFRGDLGEEPTAPAQVPPEQGTSPLRLRLCPAQGLRALLWEMFQVFLFSQVHEDGGPFSSDLVCWLPAVFTDPVLFAPPPEDAAWKSHIHVGPPSTC